MSDSLRPHGLYPTRLLSPWNSLGKNTGVGAIPSSRGSFQPRDQAWAPCVSDRFFPSEPPGKPFICSISVQFSHSVISSSLQPHGLLHARLPCPSPTPEACSNSCPLSQWCHPTISSSVVPFFCLQSFPALGSFPVSQFFVSGGQSVGVSASASVLPMNIWHWFPLGLTGLISLQSKKPSRVFSNTTVQKHQFFGLFSNKKIHSGHTFQVNCITLSHFPKIFGYR